MMYVLKNMLMGFHNNHRNGLLGLLGLLGRRRHSLAWVYFVGMHRIIFLYLSGLGLKVLPTPQDNGQWTVLT
jgi:hypothetical protein